LIGHKRIEKRRLQIESIILIGQEKRRGERGEALIFD
jgi:hypothetical protein